MGVGPHRQLAVHSRRKLVSALIDDRNVMPGQRKAERPRLEFGIGTVGDHDVGLRLTVAVVDHEPPGLFEDLADVQVEVVAGGDQPAQLR